MLRYIRLNCIVLAGILLVPSASFCSDYWLPPFANVVWTGEIVVVAYDAKDDVQVEARNLTDGTVCWSRSIPSAILARDACEKHGLVYVATWNQEIHVLRSDTGTVKACLRPPNPVAGRPLLACANNHVFVAYEDAKGWRTWLVAYSTQGFRPAWKRFFRGAGISKITANNGELEILVVNRSDRTRWEQFLFRPHNGRLIARRAARDPYYAVPQHLPKAIRRWYDKTVGGRSTLVGPTTFERRGRLWFVGVPAELNSSGMIYAVRDDGHVVWATKVNGLSSVVLAHDRLVAAAVPSDGSGDTIIAPGEPKLFALDAKTGRQLWIVGLNGSP